MATKNSMRAGNLISGTPKLGVADLTEFRRETRPFPQNAAERACYGYLLEQMRASPRSQPATKAEFEDRCRPRFRVTKKSFEYIWREAIRVSGARWDRPGRRPR
jgi:hypothetical protein